MTFGASHVGASLAARWLHRLTVLAPLGLLLSLGCVTDPGGLGENQPPGPNPGRAPDGRNMEPPDDPPDDPMPQTDAATPADMSKPVDMKPPADLGPMADRPSNPNCSFGFHAAARATPEVVLVFDRSSAMRKTVTGSTATRWNEMSAGIDENMMKTQGGVQWGLKLFPTTINCEVADGVDVQVGPANYNSVITRIRGTMPGTGPEGSPVHAGVRKAAAALAPRATTNPRFLVLLTDGIVNCPPGPPGEMETVKAIQIASGQQGVRTFVLGTATAGTPQHRLLEEFAIAGREPAAGAQKYYPVQNKAQVLAALDKITAQVTSCVLTVRSPPPAPDSVVMEIDGARVARDQTQREGWDWSTGGSVRAVHVYGNACEHLRTTPGARVEMIYGCPGISP